MKPLSYIRICKAFSRIAASIAVLCATAVFSAYGQSETKASTIPVSQPQTTEQKPAGPSPAMKDVNGVTLGMTADDVKEKLGKPDAGDDTSLFYTLPNGESLQLKLDGDKKVSMVAAIYSGKDAKAPEPTEIFGPDASVQPQADGKIYKMVRYPAAGFWIAYSRLNLDGGTMTTVTIQKIQTPQ